MISTVILATLCLAAAANNPAEQYYTELDCVPVTEPGSEQPSKYDCDHLKQKKEDQCYFKGKVFNIGDSIPDDQTSPCVTHCRCRERYQAPDTSSKTRKAEINCVNIECPSLFGVRPKEGCYNQYKVDSCCANKEHCEKDGEVATCEWEGKTYKEGERFWPSDSCMKCVCTKEFDGTVNGPWCRKLSCDLHLHYDTRLSEGCVPTYYKVNDCCPIPVFRCPSDVDKIEGEPAAAAKSGDNQCSFGNLKVSIGQRLNTDPSNNCVRCSCQVPPDITCTMDRQCNEGDRYKPDDN